MGARIGPVRRRALGRSGRARRFYFPESRHPEDPLGAMLNATRRADEERLQEERLQEERLQDDEEAEN